MDTYFSNRLCHNCNKKSSSRGRVRKCDERPRQTSFSQSPENFLKKATPPELSAYFLSSKKTPAVKQCPTADDTAGQSAPEGLLYYRKWWERIKVELSVNNQLITGIPIFTEKNVLRVISDRHSYFIPLEKIDYIRTDDGLRSPFTLPAGRQNQESN